MVFDMTKALTSALAPVFLITGIAGLLGAMGVRYGRVVDRARVVLREARANPAGTRPADVDAELRILLRRARALRLTVILAATAIFCVTVCIFLLFAEALTEIHIPYVIPMVFVLGLAFLIASLVTFIGDFAVSLRALRREIEVALGRQVS